jgi:hypothetical protein
MLWLHEIATAEFSAASHRIRQLVCPFPDVLGLVSKDISHQQYSSSGILGGLGNVGVKATCSSSCISSSTIRLKNRK